MGQTTFTAISKITISEDHLIHGEIDITADNIENSNLLHTDDKFSCESYFNAGCCGMAACVGQMVQRKWLSKEEAMQKLVETVAYFLDDAKIVEGQKLFG